LPLSYQTIPDNIGAIVPAGCGLSVRGWRGQRPQSQKGGDCSNELGKSHRFIESGATKDVKVLHLI